eukprot:jgi/Mesen1/8329/ME000046S07718
MSHNKLRAMSVEPTSGGAVSQAYIVPEEHRPALDSTASKFQSSVPVIDLAPLAGGSPERERAIVNEVGEACRKWGFFQVINHGIDERVVDSMLEQQRFFFELPLSVKQCVYRSTTNARGYFNDELTKQTRDWKEAYDFGAVPHRDLPHEHADNNTQDGFNLWPANLPAFRATMWEYFEAVEGLAVKLLDVIALSIGLPAGAFQSNFEPHSTSFLRLNYYPICSQPWSVLGVNRHKDAGALTVLLQTEKGLQVRHSSEWVDVVPIAGAFTINIGDMMQVWTNDEYKAPLHRVLVRDNASRYSAPFFANPSYKSLIEPHPLVVAATEGARYKPFHWGDFRQKRFQGDISDYGEEIQIDHYRLPL